jgi:hypothetical protein
MTRRRIRTARPSDEMLELAAAYRGPVTRCLTTRRRSTTTHHPAEKQDDDDRERGDAGHVATRDDDQ